MNLLIVFQIENIFVFSAIKWTYSFEQVPKTCTNSIYFLASTDGTLTWSILHEFKFSIKNTNTSIEIIIELDSINRKYPTGQFSWYEPISLKCANFSWSLSKIVSSKFNQ